MYVHVYVARAFVKLSWHASVLTPSQPRFDSHLQAIIQEAENIYQNMSDNEYQNKPDYIR
jgi:hypothetical protein